MLKIAVNTRLLIPNKMDGIGVFAYNTLKQLVFDHPEVEFHFFFDRKFDKSMVFAENVIPHVLYPSARHPILWYIWFEWAVSDKLRQIKPDLFLSPDGYLSLRSLKTKQLPVIHDINFLHHPESMPKLVGWYFNYYFPRFAKLGKRVATVSEYSKADLVKNYSLDADKVDVIYNGINSFFKPSSEEEKLKTKQEFSNGKDYFFYVGSIHPRKNLIRLLEAFDLFKHQNKCNTKLVIAGALYWNMPELESTKQKMKFSNDVILAGRVDDETLNRLLGASLALAYVPYFEGFGIPIIEAFECEVPVITSNVTSMPEVAGDAAILIDPYKIESISNAMLQISNNVELRNELIEKGKQQKQLFSWKLSAERLWKSIELAIKN